MSNVLVGCSSIASTPCTVLVLVVLVPAARLPVALAGSFAVRSPLGELSGLGLLVSVLVIDCKHTVRTLVRARVAGLDGSACRPPSGRPTASQGEFLSRRQIRPCSSSPLWYWHQSRRLLAGDAKRVLGPEKQVARFRRSCTSQPCSEESRPHQFGLRRKPTDRHGQRTASVQVKRTGDRTRERQVATR